MLGFVLAVLAGLPAPQDTVTLDAPVYVNQAYGVSVPRPFDDWVFEPGVGPQTTTVIFHPREEPLREQLWGALVLTTFADSVPLSEIVERRVRSTWPRLLGRTFSRVASDTLEVDGFPAIRTAMSGAIAHVALDVEEYAIARGGDLILLQFRTPRGRPYDSIAAGYRRVFAGLKIRGDFASTPAAAPAAVDWVATSLDVPPSPWQAVDYDALVRYDTASLRAEVEARMDLLNDAASSADSVPVWLWPAFVLDSVRGATGALEPARSGAVFWIRLGDSVPPSQDLSLTLFYHVSGMDQPLPPSQMNLSPFGAFAATDWLPRVQPAFDSAGQIVRTSRPRVSLGLDVPEGWKAVAQGRLTSDVASQGRRRMTWQSEQVTPAVAAFALGPYRVLTRRDEAVTVSFWLAPGDSPSSATIDTLAAEVGAAWTFCSRAFGRLPIGEINVATADVSDVRGFAGLLLVGHAVLAAAPAGGASLSLATLVREVARTWWGNSVMPDGPASGWILEGFPAWAAVAATGVIQGDTVRQRLMAEAEAAWRAGPRDADQPLRRIPASGGDLPLLTTKGVAALEAARRAAGEARFREAVLSLAREHRDSWVQLDDVLAAVGAAGAAVLRPFLF